VKMMRKRRAFLKIYHPPEEFSYRQIKTERKKAMYETNEFRREAILG
jgi:hypothetical protein